MIANIPSGSTNIKAMVFYHEKKVNQDQAKVLGGNTFSASAYGFINTATETADLNPKVYKNRFYNIDLNFSPKDGDLSDQDMLNIAYDYISKLNFTHCPHRIYRHYDRKHHHIHIVTSSINYDGIQDLKEKRFLRRRSFETCRELEKLYNLYQVKSNTRDKARYSVSELNLDCFSYQNALKKGLKQNSVINQLAKHFNITTLHSYTHNPYTNKELLSILGEKQYSKIYEILERNKLFNSHYKIILMRKLDNIRQYSNSMQEYIQLCHQNNIYVRRMQSGNQPYFKYILREGNINFEVNDSSLSARFRYHKISSLSRESDFTYNQTHTAENAKEEQQEKASKTFTIDQQKEYLKRNIFKSLNNSNTYGEFADSLAGYGIQFDFVKNKKEAIQGIRFSQQFEGAYTFNGGDLHRSLTYGNISKTLQNNMEHSVKQNHTKPTGKLPSDSFKKSHIPKSPLPDMNTGSGALSKSAADGEEEERKNRLNQDITNF